MGIVREATQISKMFLYSIVREHLRAKEARRGEKSLTFDISGESREGEGREKRQQNKRPIRPEEENLQRKRRKYPTKEKRARINKQVISASGRGSSSN